MVDIDLNDKVEDYIDNLKFGKRKEVRTYDEVIKYYGELVKNYFGLSRIIGFKTNKEKEMQKHGIDALSNGFWQFKSHRYPNRNIVFETIYDIETGKPSWYKTYSDDTIVCNVYFKNKTNVDIYEILFMHVKEVRKQFPLEILESEYRYCCMNSTIREKGKYRTREIYVMEPSLFNKKSLVSLTEIKNGIKIEKKLRNQGLFKYHKLLE
ncbi:MAG: hypothetical protein ACFFCV_05635 [Promethearchaeota archaeon]